MDWFCFSFLTIILLIFIYKTETFGGCVCVEEFANGLNLPVLFVNANDGSNRIFVGELKGVVHIFYANGTKLPDPFIDVTSRVEKLDKVTESGLSSMAFHPNFTSNGLFYMVVATKTKYFDRNVNHYSNLFEFKVSATDGNKADQNYSRLLLKFDQPVSAHNMDQVTIHFDRTLSLAITSTTSYPVKFFSRVQIMFVLRLKVPVNNFSVMSGRSHRLLCITCKVSCSMTQHAGGRFRTPTSRSGFRRSTSEPSRSPEYIMR